VVIGKANNLPLTKILNLSKINNMNFIRLKRANWVVVMAMLALPGALSTSCSKQTDPTETVAPKGDKLTISVLGINNGDSNNEKKSKASSRNSSSGVLSDQKVYESSDVDMAVSIDNTLPARNASRTVVARSSNLSSSSGLKAATPAEDGLKYVVYIYDGTTLVTSTELASGTAGTIEGLDPAASYTWVALSYSSADQAPGLTPSSGAIDLPQNTDVLYASGTVDLATDPSIGILFNHAFSRIGIELNTIGVFGEISGNPLVSVTGLDLASGSINLLDGMVTAGANYTPTLSYADFANVDPAYNDAKIAYVYTASTAEQTFSVSVQNLSIAHADGNLARTYFATAAPFSSTITPELGMNHHVLLNVVESPLTTNYGGNQVKWARSNLYYRGNNGGDRDYAFYANNIQTSRANGYFGFGGTVAGTFATPSTEGDPCALVYPAGLWRQPRETDFNSMTTSSGTLGNILSSVIGGLLGGSSPTTVSGVGTNYVEYGNVVGAPASGSNAFGDVNSTSNRLRFYYNGQINNVTALTAIGNGGGLIGLGLNDLSVDLVNQNVINLGVDLLDSYGDLTALWTHDQALNLLGLVGMGTWGYLGTTVDPLIGSNFVAGRKTAELLNGVSALGVDVLSTTLKNVRCVRN